MSGVTLVEAATDIFADAKQLHAEAIARLEAEDIRDAAEKAWCATKRATDTLILVRSGQMPEKTPDTSRQLGYLAMQNGTIRVLAGRYYSRQSQLHGDCFYSGMCEPLAETERRIRETAGYIEDAERLALGQTQSS